MQRIACKMMLAAAFLVLLPAAPAFSAIGFFGTAKIKPTFYDNFDFNDDKNDAFIVNEGGLTGDQHIRAELRLVSLESGQPLPGGTLLYDLGDFEGAPIAVPLETSEYRSGFSKEHMVRETWWHLPPRVTVTSDGMAYTIRRGRSTGLPLIGKPSGRDQLIALHWNGRRVTVVEPFAGIEAFIFDFALIEK